MHNISNHIFLVLNRIFEILFKNDVSTSRFWMSLFTLLYGFLLIFPPEGLQSYGWEVLRDFMPLYGYGVVFVFQSVLTFYIDFYQVKTKYILISGGLIGTLMWATIALVHSIALERIDPTIIGALMHFWLTSRIEWEKD